jgi:hypothetical protein
MWNGFDVRAGCGGLPEWRCPGSLIRRDADLCPRNGSHDPLQRVAVLPDCTPGRLKLGQSLRKQKDVPQGLTGLVH